jgi:UDPglucose 6-dehydrogenase
VRAFDPAGMELARLEMPDIHYPEDPYECAAGADALVIVNEWEQFRALDLDRLKREMVCPVVVDLRNIYDPNELTKFGFQYQSIGRAAKSAA